MREIEAWFRKEAARAARTPLLEDALIGGRFFPYAAYRLRYFAARTLVAATLHAVKIVLAFRFFSHRSFIAVLVVQSVATLASGFWWGSLEVLREKIRAEYRNGRRRGLDRLIGRWLTTGLRLGLAVFIAAVLYVPACPLLFGRSPSAADFFLAAILLRLALDFPARVYHSGVYAVRRVYRPLLSVILAEILSFATLLSSWPLLGLWSLPLASIVSSLASSGLVFVYTGRAYRRLDLSPWRNVRLWRRGGRLRLPGFGSNEWLIAGASYAMMRLDALLVLVLASASASRIRSGATLIFAAGPLIRAGFEWIQLFYFDLKQLNRPVLRKWREEFERRLSILSVPVALILWIPASFIARAFYGPQNWTFFAAFGLFFAGRGWLAAAQMRAYARGAYSRLFLSGIIMLAGHFAAMTFISETAEFLAVASAITLIGGAIAGRLGGESTGPAGRPEPLCLAEWLIRTRGLKGPVSVFSVEFVREPSSEQDNPARRPERERYLLQQIAGIIAAKLDGRGAAAVAAPRRLVWCEQHVQRSLLRDQWLFSLGAGRIKRLKTTGAQAGGKEALRQAAKMGFFGPGLKIVPHAEAEKACRGLFPEESSFSAYSPPPELIRRLSSAERRAILADAAAFASDFQVFRPRSSFDVMAFSENGVPRWIFLMDPKIPREQRNRLRTAVRRLNVQATLNDNMPDKTG
jgi:hypothetical protein